MFGITEEQPTTLGKRVRKRVNYSERGGAVDLGPEFLPSSDGSESEAAAPRTSPTRDEEYQPRKDSPRPRVVAPAASWTATTGRKLGQAMVALGAGRWKAVHRFMFRDRTRNAISLDEVRLMGWTVIALATKQWFNTLGSDRPALFAPYELYTPIQFDRFPTEFDGCIHALAERVRLVHCPVAQQALWYFKPSTYPFRDAPDMDVGDVVTWQNVHHAVTTSSYQAENDTGPLKYWRMLGGKPPPDNPQRTHVALLQKVLGMPVRFTTTLLTRKRPYLPRSILHPNGLWDRNIMCVVPALKQYLADGQPTARCQTAFTAYPPTDLVEKMCASNSRALRADRLLKVCALCVASIDTGVMSSHGLADRMPLSLRTR